MIYLFIIFVFSLCVFAVEIGIRVWKIGRGRGVRRCDHIVARLKNCLKMSFGHKRLVECWWGWFHLVIFYAFIVFLFSTLEGVIGTVVPGWGWHCVFGGTAGAWIGIVSQWFAWLAFIAVCVLGGRRIARRNQVYSSLSAWFILAMIAIHMISHILLVAAGIGGYPAWVQRFMPISGWVSGNFPWLGAWAGVFLWVEILTVCIFLVWLIPCSKHLHILFGFFDVFFQYRGYGADGQPVLGAEPVDLDGYVQALEASLDGRGAEPVLGVRNLSDLTWKMRLEAFSCTQCTRCSRACPLVRVGIGDKYGPMSSMMEIRRLCMAESWKTPVIPEVVSREVVESCTLCGACRRVCPLGHEHPERILEFRRAVAVGDTPLEHSAAVLSHFERSGNLWGYPRSARMDWAKGIMKAPQREEAPEAQAVLKKAFSVADVRRVLVFAGCFAAYDARASRTLQRMVSWLMAQGYEVVRMPEEACCGAMVRALGDEMSFEACRRDNLAMLQSLSFDVILTACPHCSNSLAHDYVQTDGGRFRAMHFLEFVAMLYGAGKISVSGGHGIGGMIFHMPCGLSKSVDPLRMVKFLSAIGIEAREDVVGAMCCGGGGGQLFLDKSREVSRACARSLLSLTPDADGMTLVSACPYCLEMLGDAVLQACAEKVSADGNGVHVGALIERMDVIDIIVSLARRKPAVH